jgi:hypothetical protein
MRTRLYAGTYVTAWCYLFTVFLCCPRREQRARRCISGKDCFKCPNFSTTIHLITVKCVAPPMLPRQTMLYKNKSRLSWRNKVTRDTSQATTMRSLLDKHVYDNLAGSLASSEGFMDVHEQQNEDVGPTRHAYAAAVLSVLSSSWRVLKR